MPRAGKNWVEFNEQFLLDRVIRERFPENQVIN